MKSNLDRALLLFNEYKLDEAREMLEKLLIEDSANELILVTLAKVHSRTQNYGEALNLFEKALELNSENSEAITGKKLIKNILQLTNNFYYENPYTDEDLYEF